MDELDILSVQPGQEVRLSVDALDDAELSGTVQKIAPLGDTSASVTTYDVTVAILGEDARVKGGMNVSGEIIVDTAEEATMIPTDALQKDDAGYFVTLENGETRHVEIGIMTDDDDADSRWNQRRGNGGVLTPSVAPAACQPSAFSIV
ncbi:MAG: hypothetical protein ACLUHE_01195 [Christensenellales bacterium]